jgi:hypothetical protein
MKYTQEHPVPKKLIGNAQYNNKTCRHCNPLVHNQDSTIEQDIVDVVSKAYMDVLDTTEFGTTLQKIKEYFVKRDFVSVSRSLVAYLRSRFSNQNICPSI